MFRNFFNDLLPYALNWREEIQIQETWIFAKFVKNPEIKPNYTSFKKFSMHTYSVGKQNFPVCSLSTPSWACSVQVSAYIHASWILCVRIRGSSKKFLSLKQQVGKFVFVSRLQEKLERGAESANYSVQIQWW